MLSDTLDFDLNSLKAGATAQAQLQAVYAGPAAYWITWFLQWLNLLCANVGLVVLCGECLKVCLMPMLYSAPHCTNC